MIYGLWQSAAGLQALQVRQDVLANNLANVETPGFKPDGVSFRERLAAVVTGDAPGDDPALSHPTLDGLPGGITFAPHFTDFSQASLVRTSNPLDVAIRGDGFFTVRADGAVRYTRDGQFTTRDDGALVTATGGFEVLDTAGRPIRIDRGSSEKIQIDSEGNVRQGAIPVGQLQVSDFADRAALRKAGRNLFDAADARPQAAEGRLEQYAYEGSGVEPVSALVQMIAATRAYQLNATMLTLQDQTLGRAVNDVGRAGS